MFISRIDNSVYSLSLDMSTRRDWNYISVRILDLHKYYGCSILLSNEDKPKDIYASDINQDSYINLIKQVKRK